MSDGGRLGVGKLRAQIGERAEGRERNQLGYFPGFICYLPTLARIVLWPGVTGTCDSEQRLRRGEVLLWDILGSPCILRFFIRLFNRQTVC